MAMFRMETSVSAYKKLWNVLRRGDYLKSVGGTASFIVASIVTVSDFFSVANYEFRIRDWFLLGLIVVVIVISAAVKWPRQIEGEFAGNSRIRIVEGDLLKYDQGNKHVVVVGTSCGFDTDESLIDESSVQGQVARKFFRGEFKGSQSSKTDVSLTHELTGEPDLLSEALERALRKYVEDNDVELRPAAYEGGPKQYPPGTSVLIHSPSGVPFKFLAYTTNTKKYVTCEPNMVWDALWKFWEDSSFQTEQRSEIVMPALGTLNAGMSDRLGIEGSIKLIILSYAFASQQYPNGLPSVWIVLRPKDFHKLNRSDLKQFISTLSKSN